MVEQGISASPQAEHVLKIGLFTSPIIGVADPWVKNQIHIRSIHKSKILLKLDVFFASIKPPKF